LPDISSVLDVNFAGVNPSTSLGHISGVSNAFTLRLVVVVEVSQKSSPFSKGRENGARMSVDQDSYLELLILVGDIVMAPIDF